MVMNEPLTPEQLTRINLVHRLVAQDGDVSCMLALNDLIGEVHRLDSALAACEREVEHLRSALSTKDGRIVERAEEMRSALSGA
jgi:hypothetical protein